MNSRENQGFTLLLKGYIFFKKTAKQKMKRKRMIKRNFVDWIYWKKKKKHFSFLQLLN